MTHTSQPDTATVRAVGKLTEALEAVEEARGHLYAFHRLTGTADFALEEAIGMLRDAGRSAADSFLTAHGADLGRRSSYDLDVLLKSV